MSLAEYVAAAVILLPTTNIQHFLNSHQLMMGQIIVRQRTQCVEDEKRELVQYTQLGGLSNAPPQLKRGQACIKRIQCTQFAVTRHQQRPYQLSYWNTAPNNSYLPSQLGWVGRTSNYILLNTPHWNKYSTMRSTQ